MDFVAKSVIFTSALLTIVVSRDSLANLDSAAFLKALDAMKVRNENSYRNFSSGLISNSENHCQISCEYLPINIYYFRVDLWMCGWRTLSKIEYRSKPGCTELTRSIMNNATTLQGINMRDIQSSTFSLLFSNLGIERLEDFFIDSYENLKLLAFIQNNITHIGKNTLKSPSHLLCLFLLKNSIQSIDEVSFKNFKNMVMLFIRENVTLNIKSETLGHMPLLQTLDLSKNFKINLSRDAFTNNVFLRFINLTGTQLSSFEAITSSPRVRNLILSENSLTKLEFNRRNMVIVDLQVENNLISKISENSFKILTGVRSLTLLGNPIEKIGENAFSFMTDDDLTIEFGCGRFHLQNLKMKLHKDAFRNVGKIRCLKIEGCLQNLENHTFVNVSIIELQIRKNFLLKNIFERTFYGLRDTVNLDLSLNRLQFIDKNAFAGLSKLKTLQLNDNQLKTIDSSLLDHVKLIKSLDLSNNRLERVPENLFKYQEELQTLNLGNNSISFIEKSFFNETLNLRFLILSNNKFKDMPINWMYNLKNLYELDFSGNAISRIKSLNLRLEFLEILDLSNNLIQNIPKKSLKSNSLKKFYLRANKLENYNEQEMFLDFIDLSFNNISNLLGIVRPLCLNAKKLTILLNNNKLKNIDTMELYKIPCNLHINISHNFLTNTFFLYITSFIKLAKCVDLSFNQLKTLSKSDLDTFKKMDSISLQKNPWNCNCENLELMFYLSTFKDIPCCPINCSCLIADEWNRQLFINCKMTAQSSLPYCIPFPETELDYSYNNLTELAFPKNPYRIKRLNMSFNQISLIHEIPSSQLANLRSLDLRGNSLTTVPEELRLLKDVLIVSDNPLNCDDCKLVHYLHDLMQSTSQSIHCKKTDISSAYRSCWMKETLTPILLLTILGVFVLITLFLSSLMIYLIYLRRRFPSHHNRHLASRKLYQRELKILAGLNHQNVLKMVANLYTWNPFQKFNGHLFFEKTDRSLSDFAVSIKNVETGLKLHSIRVELVKQLMLALDYLHTLKTPVLHNRICIESLHVKILGNKFTLKLLDFSDAELAATIDIDQNVDMIASAKVVRIIASGGDDRVENVEFQVLIKCLVNKGFQAADALQCPALANESSKVLDVGLLNELMIEDATDSDRDNAERHAGLIIGESGTWHQLLDPRLLRRFASRGRGYRVSSFTGLLRFSRNVVLHANQRENGDLFRRLCGSGETNPLPAEIFYCLLRPFPFFYCHSLSVLWRMGRVDSKNDVFLTTYESHEREVFESTSVRVSPEKSSVEVRLGALVSSELSDAKTWRLEFSEDWTLIPAGPLKARLLEIAQEAFPGIEIAKVIVKDQEAGVVFQPLDDHSKTPAPIMNGAILTMALMEARVRVGDDGDVETVAFRETYNVRALAGPFAGRAGRNVSQVVVMINGQRIGLRTRILDTPFGDHVFQLSFVT